MTFAEAQEEEKMEQKAQESISHDPFDFNMGGA